MRLRLWEAFEGRKFSNLNVLLLKESKGIRVFKKCLKGDLFNNTRQYAYT